MSEADPVPWLYPILTEKLLAPEDFPDAAATLADLGVALIQLRLKSLGDGAAVGVHEAVADRLARWPGTIVVNDRADLAHLLAEHSRAQGHAHRIGLHLGQTDLPPLHARAIVGDAVAIGLSTHNLEQLRAALEEPVDHVAFGPVFQTGTKDNPDPIVGLALLAQAATLARTHARPRPLVAIGGIDASTVAAVLSAGATSIAVIGALFEGGPEHVRDRVASLAAAVRNDPTRSAS